LLRCGAVQSEVSNAQQQAQDGQVDRGGDQRCDPDWDAEAEREVEDVAEAEEEGQSDHDAHDHGDGLHDRGRARS
jgi:hypothetical protein